MNRILFLLLQTVVFVNIGCHKSNTAANDPATNLTGKWIVKGTDGSGPAGTLYFANKAGTNTLSFDCSGSPGPNWPSQAETPYKFENGKLLYVVYDNPGQGYYTADSFVWITAGQEFEIKRRQLLLYMSADYTIRYTRVN